MTDNSYLFALDYGNREDEKIFVGEVLDTFDRDSLTGAMLWINNNPYSLELFLFPASFQAAQKKMMKNLVMYLKVAICLNGLLKTGIESLLK